MVSFGFILGEVVRRVTGRTIGHYLRTEIAEPMGIDVHIGLSAADHQRCADMINKPHIRDVLANGQAPGYPTSLAEHPMAGMAVAMGFVPDDELGSNELERWRSSEFPSTNGHVSALGLATFYNGLAQEKLLSREQLEAARVSQGGFDTDVVLGPRVADHGWGGWATCSTSVGWPGRTCAASDMADRAARTGSSTSNTASATPT